MPSRRGGFLTVALLAVLAGPAAPSRATASPVAPADSNRVPSETAAAWRDDLRFMARELERRHQNAFHAIGRRDFARAVAALDSNIPRLSNAQVVVGLAR